MCGDAQAGDFTRVIWTKVLQTSQENTDNLMVSNTEDGEDELFNQASRVINYFPWNSN